MKIELSKDRVAQVGVQYGEERPKLERPLPEKVQDRPFRSVKIKLTVWRKGNKKKSKTVTGKSWCNPLDQFEKFKGRKLAMIRLFEKAGELLSRKDRQQLGPLLLGQAATKK